MVSTMKFYYRIWACEHTTHTKSRKIIAKILVPLVIYLKWNGCKVERYKKALKSDYKKWKMKKKFRWFKNFED